MFKFISWIFSITAFSLAVFFLTQSSYGLLFTMILAGLIALPKQSAEVQPLGVRLHAKHLVKEHKTLSSKEVMNFIIACSLAGAGLFMQWV
ncbi:hypothetical protein [Pseudoalteromonas 'SMAR']|uniref:hypothetical protein n=1 Tax=Pseudoalteromonas 'SMAR' TaxID=3416908 RepID=UPI003AF2079B